MHIYTIQRQMGTSREAEKEEYREAKDYRKVIFTFWATGNKDLFSDIHFMISPSLPPPFKQKRKGKK